MSVIMIPPEPVLEAVKEQRSLSSVTSQFDALAKRSTRFAAGTAGQIEIDGATWEVPCYTYQGPPGGTEALRVGIFAGIHGDEPASPYALVRFVQFLETYPELAQGYYLRLYPVCNPTGFTDNTRHNRNGKDLNREFWRKSTEPEVRFLESELRAHTLQGIIALHADDSSNGVYGYAHGPVLTQHLLRPALVAASDFLPLNEQEVIDGFRARRSIIRDRFDGMLRAHPGVRPRPFEVVLETPNRAPQYLQEMAVVVALRTILAEYIKLISFAQNI